VDCVFLKDVFEREKITKQKSNKNGKK